MYMGHNMVKYYFIKKNCFIFVCMFTGCGVKYFLQWVVVKKKLRIININPQVPPSVFLLTYYTEQA